MKTENKGVKITQTAGGVVLNSNRQVLVVNQNNDSWSLPKGHIDKGESARKATEREIYEESGISELEFIKELGKYKRYKIALGGGDDKSELKEMQFFLYKTMQTKLNPVDPANPEAKWVNKEDVAEILTHKKDTEFFLSIIDKI